MKKERILALLSILIISIYIINMFGVVWAQDPGGYVRMISGSSDYKEKTFIEKAISFEWLLGPKDKRNVFGENVDVVTGKIKSALGFKSWVGIGGSLVYNFFIGLLAGMLIWALGLVERILMIKLPRIFRVRRKYSIMQDNFFAKNVMSSIVLGILYAILMVIPIVNRIIQIVTLTVLLKFINGFSAFILEIFMIAIIVGIGPGFIAYMIKVKRDEKIALAEAEMVGGIKVIKAAYQGGSRP